MSSLPPGCTDQMCEGGPEQFCANCSHSMNAHYDKGDETRNADGTIFSGCDQLMGNIRQHQCECPAFVEGEYEPEYDEDENIGY